MKVANLITAKRFEQYKNWFPSVAIYGATAFGALVYVTDWRIIADYIPFYNNKFKRDLR